jgi:hypothetical protein
MQPSRHGELRRLRCKATRASLQQQLARAACVAAQSRRTAAAAAARDTAVPLGSAYVSVSVGERVPRGMARVVGVAVAFLCDTCAGRPP